MYTLSVCACQTVLTSGDSYSTARTRKSISTLGQLRSLSDKHDSRIFQMNLLLSYCLNNR